MKIQNKINPNVNILIGYIVLIIVATSASILSAFIIKKIKTPTTPLVIQTEEKPSQYPDYDAIKGQNPDLKIKAVRITSHCPPDGCKNDRPATIDFDGINKRYEVKGEFSRAYLYIEGSVDYGRPLTTWDDFYFSLNSFGGHLIDEDNSLPVPPGDFSRYLYDLRSISYYPTIQDKEKRINKKVDVDLFRFFHDGAVFNISTTISSNRPGRIMEEVSLYYECFEGSSCNIGEIK